MVAGIEPPVLSHPKNRFPSTRLRIAVNATKSFPPKNKHLYEALNELDETLLGRSASADLSWRCKGLDNEHPTIEVALLGLLGLTIYTAVLVA